MNQIELLAAASHDLRQPLQTLHLLNTVLEQAVPAESTAGAALAAQADALAAMSNLVDALLDISRLEADAIQPVLEDCSVRAIFERIQAQFMIQARAKGLRLIVDDGNVFVRSDPALLEQVIRNLVANAIRYTRCGRVQLRCLAGSTARIEVLDTGVGIGVDELGSIFDAFYQVHSDRGPRNEGFGLGLAIVDRLSQLLGHRVDVESIPGEGSCFSITVPKANDPLPVGAPGVDAPVDSGHGHGHGHGTVLVIDDDVAVADATAMLLESVGYQVSVAIDTEQAFETLGSPRPGPNLVICDLHLGAANSGIETVRAVREFVKRSVAVLLVTGDTSSSAAAMAQQLDDCILLRKPIDGDELLDNAARMIAA